MPFSMDAQVLADVPFERAFGGIPFVGVRVDDSEPLQFMIDTGGAGSIIDQEVAARLGLQSVPARASVAGNEALDVRVVPKATIRLGGAALETRLSIHRLAPLAPAFGRRIDGILGGDFFGRFVVELNYDRDRVRVYERYVWNGKGVSLPLTLSNGVPFVDLKVRVSGRTLAGKFLVDSAGGWMAVHVHRQVFPTSATGVAETGLGLGGATKRDVIRGEAVVVGTHEFSRPPVAITDDTAGLRTDPSSLGLVGIEILRKFNVVLDYRGKRAFLTPSRELARPLVYDTTGLRLLAAPPRFAPLSIARVLPSSPASEAGLQAGDVIVDVNGRPAPELEQLREMLRVPRKQHLINVRRDGRTVRLLLITRELL
jgi:predicted aspartyl protease